MLEVLVASSLYEYWAVTSDLFCTLIANLTLVPGAIIFSPSPVLTSVSALVASVSITVLNKF